MNVGVREGCPRGRFPEGACVAARVGAPKHGGGDAAASGGRFRASEQRHYSPGTEEGGMAAGCYLRERERAAGGQNAETAAIRVRRRKNCERGDVRGERIRQVSNLKWSFRFFELPT